MWFDTLVLQLRLHMAYRVNGILYRLRFLSLSYESGFAKTLGLVLAILRELGADINAACGQLRREAQRERGEDIADSDSNGCRNGPG